MSHQCHARGCTIPVPPEKLMCRDHWFMVPKNIRDAVWANYRAGQCDDKRPSKNWHEAADAAIGFVALREGHKVTVAEAKAVEAFGLGKWLPKKKAL